MEAIDLDQVRPLRRVEYDQLVELGAFHDERIELVHGALVQMSPIGPLHSATVSRLNTLLVQAFAPRALVRCQQPLAAGDFSEPEPDFAIVPPGDYDRAHPAAALLVLEVSDSSLAFDRGTKLRLYAQCGFPEYWIVNLVDRRIEVFRMPQDGNYTSVQSFSGDDAVAPLAFPDVRIAPGDVLGPG